MLDILYLTHNRCRFCEASLASLQSNTQWSLVNNLWILDDLSFDGTLDVVRALSGAKVLSRAFGGPVGAMNHFLDTSNTTGVFAKIDSDTILPPGWLEVASGVMERHPELDLLGIEPPQSRTPSRAGGPRMAEPELTGPIVSRDGLPGYAVTPSIGGIGLMRRSAWGNARMQPHGFRGVGGFTTWQLANPQVTKGWIAPPLRMFLLDRLPVEPWCSLSDRYIAEGVQRPWTRYDPQDAELWNWWSREALAA